MLKQMFPLQIEAGDNKLFIRQSLSGEEDVVVIARDQVELVCSWLKEASQTNSNRLPCAVDSDLVERVQDFLDAFELVFGPDWEMTLTRLNANPESHVVSPTGNFLEPKVEDESDNWANRGALLASYRTLKQALAKDQL